MNANQLAACKTIARKLNNMRGASQSGSTIGLYLDDDNVPTLGTLGVPGVRVPTVGGYVWGWEHVAVALDLMDEDDAPPRRRSGERMTAYAARCDAHFADRREAERVADLW